MNSGPTGSVIEDRKMQSIFAFVLSCEAKVF